MKALMKRCKEAKDCFWAALVEWRLAQRINGPSPAQLFFRRQVRSGRLPEISGPLDMYEVIEQKEASQRRGRVMSTVRHARTPMALQKNLLLQDRETKMWSIKGQIMSIRPNGGSYVVRTEDITYLLGIQFIKADSREHAFVVMSAQSRKARLQECGPLAVARRSLGVIWHQRLCREKVLSVSVVLLGWLCYSLWFV